MSVYEDVITAEQLIDQCFDLTTGEINEEQEAQAIKLKEEILSQGLEKLCKVRVNKLSEIETLKAEERRIAERRQKAEKSLRSLEDYIYAVYQKGDSEVQKAGSFTLSTRKSTQVVTDENFFDERFIRTTTSIDKVSLKKALQDGLQVFGAKLQTNYNLQIK